MLYIEAELVWSVGHR